MIPAASGDRAPPGRRRRPNYQTNR